MWDTLKNPNFEKILVFERSDGPRMPKMYSGEVQNVFAKFLNFLSFFNHLVILSKWFEILKPKNELKMAKYVLWETLKNINFEKILIFEGFDGSRMLKMYSGEVLNIFEKFLNFFQFFTPPWPFSARILKFLGPKWAQNGLIWCVGNPEKPKFWGNFDFWRL